MTPDAWAMVDRWTLPRRCNLSSLVMMVREGALTDEERKTHKIVTMVSGWALSHAVDTPPEIVATSNWKLSMTIDEARDFLNLLVAPFGNAGVVVKHSQSASERRHSNANLPAATVARTSRQTLAFAHSLSVVQTTHFRAERGYKEIFFFVTTGHLEKKNAAR
jgi:hypothetical protein